MFKKIAVGTAFLAAALAVVPTAVQAQDRYYGNSYGGGYSGYSYSGELYGQGRYRNHEDHERRERLERLREYREHLRRERERHFEERRYNNGYYDYHNDRRY